MQFQQSCLARAIACALASASLVAYAEDDAKYLAPIIVTADPFGSQDNAMILAPAKVLAGDELHDKLSGSLGDTLSNELGVHASGFSAGASRPVIRGLEGPRVKILQNGLSVTDLSAISSDHAVGASIATARQIEILRGPAALLYGSGAIGGLVNIVNDRIPSVLEKRPTGEAELRHSTVDRGTALHFSGDGASGEIGLHVDGNISQAGDYRIPGNSVAPGAVSDLNDTNKLSFSRNREKNLAFGASLIKDWGHIGASVSQLNKVYGIHGADERSKIDMAQTRFDVDTLIKSPFSGFEGLRIKLGQNNYEHTELEDGVDPHIRFKNNALESRWELSHLPLSGWRGKLGIQTEQGKTEASNLEDPATAPTVPRTRSQSTAFFLVEERSFGNIRVNLGGRYEAVSRKPVAGLQRSFALGSYSAGALWSFIPGYGLGTTASVGQRAPTAEELYSNGVHHPTETFDNGDDSLKKETSKNIELSLQKTREKLRWKANVYQNKVKNFIYGAIPGDFNPVESDMRDRNFSQANATLRGTEVEISYNLTAPGWFGRLFADSSRGTLDDLGNLPLQPASRTGLNVGYQNTAWRSNVSVLNVNAHNRIASTAIADETTTKGYTRVDASLSYAQRYGNTDVTWFLLARNLLDEDIRISTSLLKDYVPQPGRNFVIGMRSRF